MFRYDLTSLSPETFAKVCHALLLSTVSAQIRPFDTVGADGGRDSDFVGRGTGSYQHLDGYWVFQYKHHDVTRLGVRQARGAVRADVRAALERLHKDAEQTPPQIFFLLTNVPFSGTITVGTHDWFRAETLNYDLTHAEIWDYTKLETLLDLNYEVRRVSRMTRIPRV